ncbi:MAG: HDOD domain-containing protein [Nitrospirae bacterium]|nr:HDOD domain-containing protein [Nitrospirota bacterium]
MGNKREEIHRAISNVSNLPTLPGVISKLNSLVENDRSSIDQMSHVISSDQTLSARVLKLVNSPFYGFPGRVSTVSHALILLGVNVVKGLTLSASIFELMEKQAVGLWEHSLGTAVIARFIAKELGHPDLDSVSTAALLHDIGRVVLKVMFVEDYQKIQTLISARDATMLEVEQEVLNTDHAEIGSWLARAWNLPEKLIEPIAFHHSVERAKEQKTVASIVHLSDVLVKGYGFGFSGDEFVSSIQQAAWEHLSLTDEKVEKIVSALEMELMDARSFSFEVQAG